MKAINLFAATVLIGFCLLIPKLAYADGIVVDKVYHPVCVAVERGS
jgi:hypothetical protein